LEKEAVRLRAELLGGTYRHGAYTYFTIQEPKHRLVAAAPFRDRVVHHAIVRVLEPIFEKRFIADSFACRKGKGTHAALRRARGASENGVLRGVCGAARGTTTRTTCNPPTATTTIRRTRTTMLVSVLRIP
jgi:hypothetical protein